MKNIHRMRAERKRRTRLWEAPGRHGMTSAGVTRLERLQRSREVEDGPVMNATHAATHESSESLQKSNQMEPSTGMLLALGAAPWPVAHPPTPRGWMGQEIYGGALTRFPSLSDRQGPRGHRRHTKSRSPPTGALNWSLSHTPHAHHDCWFVSQSQVPHHHSWTGDSVPASRTRLSFPPAATFRLVIYS